MPKELTGLEVVRVAAVGKAANKRRWLLLKSDDAAEEDLPADLEDELAVDEDAGDTEAGEETPMQDESNDTLEEGGTEEVDEELIKAMDAQKAELEDAQKAELEAVKKAAAEKDARLAQLEALVQKQAKDAREGELAAFCKAAGLDFEAVYKAEQTDPDGAKLFEAAIDKLVKQVDAFVGQEKGTARTDDGADGAAKADQEAKRRVEKGEAANYRDALFAVLTEHPEWEAKPKK
ncbi:MAG: hypothetical protein KJ888_20775 [Gammaproteobacteria bacterium]|nr:hypothetical protein [Gammaproteobacteria bacterium]